jgi:hypothetical protein
MNYLKAYKTKLPDSALAELFFTRIERTRSQLLDLVRHLGGDFGKAGALSRREIVHLDALRLHVDLFQGLFHIFDFTAGFEISFQEMAFSLQSAGDVNGIGAAFYCAK